MENKKHKKYDLERKRPIFFGVGMIISLSLTLVAFEWRSEIEPIVIPQPEAEEDWVIYIDPIVTRQTEPEPPKPMIQEKKVLNQASLIKVVEEDLFEPKEIEAIDQSEDIVIDIPLPFIKDEEPEEVFIFVEEKPEFPGGLEEMYRQIAKELKYPRKAQRLGIEGRVSLSFIIDKEGRITEVEVTRGIGAGCDEEAKRVLQSLPNFSPGKQRGTPVKVRMQIPINFRLQ